MRVFELDFSKSFIFFSLNFSIVVFHIDAFGEALIGCHGGI